MLVVAGLVIELDVHVVEPDLAALDAGKGIADVQLALADGFNLRATEFHAAFVAFEDVIIPECFAIGGDFVGHETAV